MNYDDLLNEYLDGTISESAEQSLFSAMAQNDMLRKEFNEALLLRTAVRNDAAGVIPPAELTAAVFASAGYTTANAITLWLAKYWGVFTTVFLTGLVVWLLLHRSGENTNFAQMQTTSIIHDTVYNNEPLPTEPAQQILSVEQYNILLQDNQNLHTLTNTLRNEIKNLREELQFATVNNQLATINTTNNSVLLPKNNSSAQETTLGQSEESIRTATPSSVYYVPLEQPTTLRKVVTNAPDLFGVYQEHNSLWDISLRSTLLKQQNANEVPTNDNIGVTNVVATGFYKWRDYAHVGIEVGREQFAQEYTTTLNNGNKANVLQNPTLLWGGISSRFLWSNFLNQDVATPYLQLTGALTSVGEIGRAMIGVHLNSGSQLHMMLGVESAQLWYSVQGSSYTSSKVGLFYGISYGL